MPAELFTAGAVVLSWFATYFVHSTCLVVGVWSFLRWRPATGPAVREALWKTALVGGLLTTPAQILLGCSPHLHHFTLRLKEPRPAVGQFARSGLMTFDATLTEDPSADRTWLNDETDPEGRDIDEGIAQARLWIVELDDSADTGEKQTLPRAAAAAVPTSGLGIGSKPWWSAGGRLADDQLPALSLLAIFLFASLASMAFGVGRYVWQTLSLKRRLAGAGDLVDGPARHLLDELCRLVPHAPAVRLLVAPHFTEPAAFGLTRWTIVLPERAERDLSHDELRALLAHELAHLVRGDTWWLLASRLICSCCGFQPLNHLARREWQRSAEYLCDAWAVSRTGNRLSLARCLAEVAGWRWNRSDCAASLAATGRRSGLADRIERLVDDSPLADAWSDLRLSRAMTALCGLLLAGLIGFGPQVRLTTAAPADSAEGSSGGSNSPMNDRAQVITESLEQHLALEGEQDEVSIASMDEVQGLVFYAAESLVAALDQELAALERDLVELWPLLRQPHVPPAAIELGERLEQGRLKLQKRREVLQRFATK
ncbi:MAG: M56 family metallopeptidase [Planctomycetaceae bacterium]|nr:M56 family metallopeptidase [Planctomycetaceae bacterium]